MTDLALRGVEESSSGSATNPLASVAKPKSFMTVRALLSLATSDGTVYMVSQLDLDSYLVEFGNGFAGLGQFKRQLVNVHRVFRNNGFAWLNRIILNSFCFTPRLSLLGILYKSCQKRWKVSPLFRDANKQVFCLLLQLSKFWE